VNNLTDTQLVLLSQASQREDRCAQLPPTPKGGAAQKLVAKLLAAGLVEEIRAGQDMPVWRRADDGSFALRITDQGLAAISAEGSTPKGGERDRRPESRRRRADQIQTGTETCRSTILAPLGGRQTADAKVVAGGHSVEARRRPKTAGPRPGAQRSRTL
jgi:hypothetical protein